MYNKSRNPSVLFSLNTLADAMEKLLKDTDMQHVTISALCLEAQLSRSAFYNNLDNTDDLFEYIIDRKLDMLTSVTDKVKMFSKEYFLRYFDFWYANKDFLQILFDRGLFDKFYVRLVQYGYYNEMFPILDNVDINEEQKYHCVLFTGGLGIVLRQWIYAKYRQTPEEMAEIIYKAIRL